MSLSRRSQKDPGYNERIEKVFEDTRDAAYHIIDAKGSTSYGIGMALARITRAVIQNQAVALPVSAYLQGEYGKEDVFIGTPAIVDRSGVNRVIELELDEHEKERFENSYTTLNTIKEEIFG